MILSQPLHQLLRPVSKHISGLRAAAEIISRSPIPGLKLLLDSRATPQTQTQPDVYPFAAYLGRLFDCTHAIAIGQPTAQNLRTLFPQFEIVGIVGEADVKRYRERYGFARWVKLSDLASATLPTATLERSIIICSDLVVGDDGACGPESLLLQLKAWMAHAPVCVLAAPNCDQTELEELLRAEGFNLEFVGLTLSDDVGYEKKTFLAVITKTPPSVSNSVRAPDDFRVVAFMAAYNEEDIIVESIKKWTSQGVSVHVLENWSTDATYNLITDLTSEFPVTVERFPPAGPSPFFDWGAMLARIEQLAGELEADWFVRRGADEVLASPWPGLTYKDGLYLADQAGYNCIDHTIIEFYPVDDCFEAGMDHEVYFRHFDFKHLSHHFQRKAWKNYRQPISTIPSAGHDVIFAGRRVYPFKFMLKHYSFRSQQQAERKVFRDRKARWNPRERKRGWHIHYDSMQEGHQFVASTAEKEFFEEANFNRTYLVERLSGIGVDR